MRTAPGAADSQEYASIQFVDARRVLEAIQQIDRAIQSSSDTRNLLDTVIGCVNRIFASDRAWLFYPCNPRQPFFDVVFESTRHPFSGARALGEKVRLSRDMSEYCSKALAGDNRPHVDPEPGQTITNDIAIQFNVQSLMYMALKPRVGDAWMFGLHQCDHNRVWTDDERKLFQLIGNRISGCLNNMLSVEELRKSEEKFRNLVATAPFGIQMTDLEGRIVYSNPAHHRLQGYPDGELIGNFFWDLIADEQDRVQTRNYYEQLITEQPPPQTYHNVDRTKDGRKIQTQIDWDYMFDSQGELTGVISVVTDITRRKKAEEALAASEQRYRTLFEQNINPIAFINSDGRYLEANPSFLRFVETSRADLLGMNVFDFTPPGRESEAKADHLPLWREGGIIETDYLVNDRIKTLELSISPVIYKGHHAIVGIGRDITDQKRVEKALLKSEEKWRNVLVNTPQVGVALDPDGRIVFVNEHLLGLTGWSHHEVLGKDWFEMFLPETVREKVREKFQVVMHDQETSGCSRYENEIVGKSGEIFNISWSNVLSKDAEGNILDVTCLGVDLSERKRAEDELRKSEENYRTMVEAITDPVYICSDKYRIQFMNRSMSKRVGYDATGEFCYKALHGFDAQCPWCTYDTLIEKGHTEKNITSPKDNRSFNVSSTIIKNPAGGYSKISVYRDTTEFIKLQNRLQQAQKMESIGNLAGGIAHDFNNILAPIIGLSEMLLEDLPQNTSQHEHAEDILKAGVRGSELVKQILTFSRQQEHIKRPWKLQQVLKEVIKLSRSTIPSNISITESIQQDCGLVMANATQIHQIAMNLITNASHAIAGGNGRIIVELKEVQIGAGELSEQYLDLAAPGTYARLTVTDDGAGIDRAIIKKIFEPYFTTKGHDKGTGLGLAVVYGIVKDHQGDVKVYSEPGLGTTFTVYLPLLEKDAGQMSERKKIGLPRGNERILLVDDEIAILRLETEMLKRLGYSVTAIADSQEALKLLADQPDCFDLVITDMTMPNMTGDTFAHEIMSIKKNMPIIICTGFSEKLNEEQAAALGIQGFLMKPVGRSELAHMIRALLDGRGI